MCTRAYYAPSKLVTVSCLRFEVAAVKKSIFAFWVISVRVCANQRQRYARSSDNIVTPAASSGLGSNRGLPPLVAVVDVAGLLCFFGLLAHNSVRLDCCGGAFFPGGIAKNFANRRRVK